MSYKLHVTPHPLGVVVSNVCGDRELLIEGESCCGIEYRDLQSIANVTGNIEIAASPAEQCRLLRA